MQAAPKTVSFSTGTPEIHAIPPELASWAPGEKAEPPTEYEQANMRMLAERALDEAQAQINSDAYRALALSDAEYALAGYRSDTPATHYFQSLHPRGAPEYAHQVRRKPLPVRAQTVDSAMSSMTPVSPTFLRSFYDRYSTCSAVTSSLASAVTERRFSDFIASERIATFDDVKHKRSRNLHPFQDLVTMGFMKAKKEATKAAAKVEMTIHEYYRARR
jgi:hypothetical protein